MKVNLLLKNFYEFCGVGALFLASTGMYYAALSLFQSPAVHLEQISVLQTLYVNLLFYLFLTFYSAPASLNFV